MKASQQRMCHCRARSTSSCLPQSQCPALYIIDMSSISYLQRLPFTGSEPETESTTDFPSPSESSYNPSETSGDRDFVVSDTETLSRHSFSDYSAENGISDNADDISIENVNSPLSLMIHPNRTKLTADSLISTASGRSKSWRRDRPIATDGLRPNIWSYGVPGKTQI
jgi:hypothetical protein